MNTVLFSATVISATLIVAFVFLFRKISSRQRFTPLTAEWINALSLERYRPLERLLREDDYRFLLSQPGFRPKMARKLKAERRSIFRSYLHCLARDFARICHAIKILTLESQSDRPDLALVLLKQRALFALAFAAVHARLTLNACGFGTVDVSHLVQALEAVRLEFQQLAQVPALAHVSAAA